MDLALQTVNNFTNQCRQALEETGSLHFPLYRDIRNICVCAMGASSFGYHLLKSLFINDLKIPVLLNNTYSLPAYISKNSLVVLSSYSGETEEVISCFHQAQRRGAKITGITKENSTLGKYLTKNRHLFYRLIPAYNPSNQPRMATGYTIGGLIGLLIKLKLLPDYSETLKKALDFIDSQKANIDKLAGNLADRLVNKQVIIFSGPHLLGNAHILRNQLNETAKNFSNYYGLPELNHHLLESLRHPESLDKSLIVLVLNSVYYDNKIKIRLALTTEVVSKHNMQFITVGAIGDSKITEGLWLTALGGFLSYYLAKLNGEDPLKIPWVDNFKKKLRDYEE